MRRLFSFFFLRLYLPLRARCGGILRRFTCLSMVFSTSCASVNSIAEFVREKMVLPCLDPPSGIRIDFIFSYSPYERQALKRVRRVKMGKAQVRFASPEDLIIHKIIAGRPRDLEDVRTILLKNPRVNKRYIRKWLGQFEKSLGEPFVQHWNKLEKRL